MFRVNVSEKITGLSKLCVHTNRFLAISKGSIQSESVDGQASFENGEQSIGIWNEVTHCSGTADNIA